MLIKYIKDEKYREIIRDTIYSLEEISGCEVTFYSSRVLVRYDNEVSKNQFIDALAKKLFNILPESTFIIKDKLCNYIDFYSKTSSDNFLLAEYIKCDGVVSEIILHQANAYLSPDKMCKLVTMDVINSIKQYNPNVKITDSSENELCAV